jgi:hypothetical protein
MPEDRVIGSQFGKPQIRKRTRGSWTVNKEDQFLLELGMTCNVTASARVVRMSARSAYHRRAKHPSFRAAWAIAVNEGYERLELCLLERAIGGKRKPVWYLGKRVGSVRDYPDSVALGLLKHHRTLAKAAAPAMSADEIDEERSKLLKRLKLIRANDPLRVEIDSE